MYASDKKLPNSNLMQAYIMSLIRFSSTRSDNKRDFCQVGCSIWCLSTM